MLTAQIRKHFHIEKDWSQAGYFETQASKQFDADLRAAIMAGRLIAVSGPVGSGKTMMMNRLQQDIIAEKKIIAARSLSIDKARIGLPALMAALFLDISGDPELKVPQQPEKRERQLQELIRNVKKPVVLFIDEAHDLHGNTLIGLKRLMEIVVAGDGILSVVLVGHPRLQNDLKRPTMEEIGHRTTKFEFRGLGDDGKAFLDWLLKQCLARGAKTNDVVAVEAREFMADKLSTPLQFAEHLERALTETHRLGEPTVTREIVEETISFGFDDLDARLARLGYSPKALSEQFGAGVPEIKRFMKGKLDPDRTEELGIMMRRAGLPI